MINKYSLPGIDSALSKEYYEALGPSESLQFTQVRRYLPYLRLPVRNGNLQPLSGPVSLLSISLGVPHPLPTHPKRTLVEDTPAKRHFTPAPEDSLKCIIRVSGRHFQGNLIH